MKLRRTKQRVSVFWTTLYIALLNGTKYYESAARAMRQQTVVWTICGFKGLRQGEEHPRLWSYELLHLPITFTKDWEVTGSSLPHTALSTITLGSRTRSSVTKLYNLVLVTGDDAPKLHPKWPVLCRVGRWTLLTHSLTHSLWSYIGLATKAKAYNPCRAPQAATATSEALVMSQAKLA